MEWIEWIANSTSYIIPFLVVITIIVFFHELGHYIAARINKVHVECFSIGFGPELFGWNDKRKTRWKVCIIPLGGYIKMAGDAGASSKPDQSKISKATEKERESFIHTKKPWQKIVVAASGPVANFILTIVLLSIVFATSGKKEGDPVVGAVIEGSVAESIGLKAGDRFEKVEIQQEGEPLKSHEISHFRQVEKLTNDNAGKPLIFTIKRGSEVLTVTGTPRDVQDESLNVSVGRLGIMPVINRYPLLTSIVEGVKVTWDLTVRTLVAIGNMLIGREDASQLGGLFLIAKGAHDFFEQGLGFLLEFMAILSLNLGIINLFPIPMLDGGHIVFYLVEAIRGRPVSEKAQEYAFRVGFVLLIGLMIFSHFNDILRYNFFGKIMSLFK